jgi:drug/metabolite transporter (DMT)-like permease
MESPGRGAKIGVLWTGLLASDTAAQLLIKTGSVVSHASGRPRPPLILGYSLLVVSFALWMQILRVGRLSIALSTTSLLYITIPIAAHFILKEPLTGHLIAGAFFVGLGVLILGLHEKPD